MDDKSGLLSDNDNDARLVTLLKRYSINDGDTENIHAYGNILSGLKPGVVSALIDLGAEPEGLISVLNLDDAFQMLEGIQKMRTEPSELLDDEQQESNSDPGQE